MYSWTRTKMTSSSSNRYENRALYAFAALAFLAVGCGKETSGPQRVDGAWRQTVTLVKMETNGALAQAANPSIGVPQVSDPYCLTRESVSADTLESRLTDTAVLGPEWTMGPITLTDGKVSASATSAAGKITYAGQLNSKLSDITMTTAAGVTAQSQTTTILRTRAEHIGPCTPDMVTMGQ
jgi:hypothetical protein